VARRRPRIGVLAKATQKSMPAVRANFDRSLAVLAQFCEIVPNVALPDHPYGAAVGTIVNTEGAAAFRDPSRADVRANSRPSTIARAATPRTRRSPSIISMRCDSVRS